MPRSVTMPDGFVVDDVPDNVTDADLAKRYESTRFTWGVRGNPVLESVLQGATFGASDEMQAAMGAVADVVKSRITGGEPASFGDRYKQRQAILQQDINQFRGDYPALDLALGVGGGLVSGGAAGRAAGAMAPPVARALQAAPGIVKYPIAGAASGAVAGGMSAQPGERAQGAAVGGMLGFGAGALVPPAMSLAARLPGQGSTAQRKIAQALQRDDTSAEQVAKRLTRNPGAALMDVAGENTRGLAETIANQPGPGRNMLNSFLYRRNLRQASRILRPLEETLGSGREFVKTVDDLMASRAQAAKPLYDAAYKTTVELSGELDEITKTDAFKRGLSAAKKIASNEGIEIADDLNEMPLRVWDIIKRGIDDVVSGAKDQRTGKLTELGRSADQVRRRLLAELDGQSVTIKPDGADTAVSAYSAARAAYAGPSKSMEALEMGRTFLREPAAITIKQIREMPPGDAAFFRQGVATSMREAIQNKPDTGNVVTLFNREGVREKLRAAFPDRASFFDFMRTIRTEARMARTNAQVTGNSRTAFRQAAADDSQAVALADVATTAASAGLPSAASTLGRMLPQFLRSGSIPDDIGREAAGLLMSRNPAEMARLTQQTRLPLMLLDPGTRLLGASVAGMTGGLLGTLDAGRPMEDPLRR